MDENIVDVILKYAELRLREYIHCNLTKQLKNFKKIVYLGEVTGVEFNNGRLLGIGAQNKKFLIVDSGINQSFVYKTTKEVFDYIRGVDLAITKEAGE